MEPASCRTRLLNQVDERRNPRTRAALNQLLDRWLEVVELEQTTRRGYVRKLDTTFGPCSAPRRSALDAEILESCQGAPDPRDPRCGAIMCSGYRAA